MKRARKVLPIIIFLSLILITGCGDNKEINSISADSISGDGAQDKLHLYSQERIFDNFQYILLSETYENLIYIYGSMKEKPEKYSLYCGNILEGSIEDIQWEMDDDSSVLDMAMSDSGELWIVGYTEKKGGEDQKGEYQISIFSDKGIIPFEHDKITDYLPIDIFVNETNEKVYMRGLYQGQNCIFVYNMEGEQLAKIEAGDKVSDVVFSEKENRLFLTEKDGNTAMIKFLNENGYTIEPIIQIETTTSNTILSESKNYSFNIDVNSILMGFDFESKTFTPIIDWLANGMDGGVPYVFPYDGGYIAVRRDAANQDIVVRLLETSELQSAKTILKLATMENDDLINLAVANFNKSNRDYAIEIVDYSMYGDDGLTKMNVDIISGDVPDLFNMAGLPADKYIALGILEDLTPYMEKGVNMDDLWSSAMKVLSNDNKYYLVVPGFSIHAIIGNAKDIREIADYSYFEMLNYIRERSDGEKNVFGNGMDRLEFVQYMVSNYMDQFIDYGAKTCSFDSDGFIELLETARGLSPYDEQYDEFLGMSSGDQPISFQEIWTVSDIDLFTTLYKNNLDYMGFCNIEDNKTGVSMSPEYSFGMSAASKYKDGIWEFLKGLYSEEFQQYISGIPMSKTAFEKKWNTYKKEIEGQEQKGYAIGNNMDIVVEFLPMEERLAFHQKNIDLISNIDRLYQEDANILAIINEEAPDCLNGEKEASEAARIIQNRVQTYMNE